jgi:exopolysaccharide biosynthesis polyprenyl glycosylphosphotransferase
MNKKIQTLKFILADWLAAALAWGLFYIYRKLFIESATFTISVADFNRQFIYGILLLPVLWIILYASVGTYKNVYRKSRLKEVGQTILLSVIGVLVIFFTLLLDDTVISYKTYYHTFFTLLGLHFFITVILRLILATRIIHRLRKGVIGFNTIIIGSNQKAVALLEQMKKEFEPAGNRFVGFVHVEGNNDHLLMNRLPHLGNIYNLQDIISQKNIEEAIIAIESSEHDRIGQILNELEDIPVLVKIIPDMYDILSGSVRMNNIYGAPLIEISPELMPAWQQSIKRMIDISFSLFVFIFLSPLYILAALGVLISSRGPLFYSHERIGLHGKPFRIYKFRSMYVGAEQETPKLSSSNDERITPFGKWMRKIRLDEIPQFWNVLIGDMSIVGPRPERQFFIDQIMQTDAH